MNTIQSGLSSLAIESLPAVGAAVGSMISPGLGTEIGAMAGQTLASSLEATTTSGGGTFQDAPPPTSEIREITNFAGEETSQIVSVDPNQEFSPVQDITSLQQFFRRPVRITKYPLSSLHPYWWPQAYFMTPQVAEKLKGYSGARFTMCVRLVSNATPFSNGAYALTFHPGDMYYPGLKASPYEPEWTYAGDTLSSVVCAYHCPRVIHDVAKTTSTEFKVKWWSQLRFFDTGTLLGKSSTNLSAFDMAGRFDLINVSKALNPDSQVVFGSMSIYMWLEDLELFYPTSYDSIHAQKVTPVSYTENKLLSPSPFPAVAEEDEEDNSIPVADGPEHHSHHQRSLIVSRNDRIDDVAHPPGITKPMALTETQVEVHGACDDSMVEYFKIPSLLGKIDLTTNTEGAGLIHVRPFTQCNIVKHITSLTPPLDFPPPTKLAVSTDFYQFWRGSIDYTFSFIVSKFHTARIQFGFVPHVALSLNSTQILAAEDLWSNIESTVLDLRDTSELTINCPYRLSTFMAYRSDVSGTLIWRTLNPLQAQAGASTRIIAVVETSAGSDFTVARYNPSRGAIGWFGSATEPKGTAPVAHRLTGHFSSAGESSATEYRFPAPNPTSTLIPTADGFTVGGSSQEHVPDVVNDGPVSFSQAFAALTKMDSTISDGIQTMYIGADNDILVNGWTIPRPPQSGNLSALQAAATPLSKLRSLFYGIRSDTYIDNTTLQTKVKYGLEETPKDICFPYAGNCTYYGYGNVLYVSPVNGPKFPFGTYVSAPACLPGARLFLPWTVPLINAISPPRLVSLSAVTSRLSPPTKVSPNVGLQ